MRRAPPYLALAAALLTPLSAGANTLDIRPVITRGADAAQVDEWVKAGRDALYRKDFEAAYDALTRALIERPEDGDIQLSMGDALLGLSQFAGALKHYRAAPASAQSFAGIVLSKAALGASEDVEVDLNAALEINLSDTRLWLALGRFYDSEDRSLEAQSTYVQALKFGADHAVIVNSLGMSLLRAGRQAQALEKFQQANAIAPDVEVFDNNRRLALALQGDFDGAISGVTESRAAHIYNDAGFIAAKTGKPQIAKILYRQALQISPVYFPPAKANLDALKTAG